MQQVIDTLISWGNGVTPRLVNFGICANIEELHGLYALKLIKCHFKTWEHFSGDEVYPVSVSGNAEHDYNIMCTWGKMEYGQLRRQLCLHIAACLQAENTKTERVKQ